MLKHRPLREALLFLQNAMLLFALFLCLEFFFMQAANARPWTIVLALVPSLLSYVTGRLSQRLSAPLALLLGPVSGLLAAGLSLLVPGSLGIPTILSAVSGVGLYYFFRSYYPGVNSAKFSMGVLFYLAVSVTLFFHPQDFEYARIPANVVGICFLALGLYSLNNVNLKAGMRIDEDSGQTAFYPDGMLSGNFKIITLFAVVAFLISSIGFLRTLFQNMVLGFRWIGEQIMAFLLWLEQLGAREIQTIPPEPNISGIFEEEVAVSPATLITMQILWVLCVIAFVLIILRLFYRAYKYLKQKFPEFFEGIKAFFLRPARMADGVSFVDQRESLIDWGDFTLGTRRQLKKVLKRIRGPEKLRPDATPREKLRFTYRTMLNKKAPLRPDIVSRTPNEVKGDTDIVLIAKKPEFHQFIDAYDRARYSSQELDSKDGAAAVRVLEELKKE